MRITVLLASLLVGCVGSVAGGPEVEPLPGSPGAAADTPGTGATAPGAGGTTTAGGPAGSSGPAAGRACTMVTLPRPRTWRLTHTQLRNTLADVVGFSSATFDALPADARVIGYANQADLLNVAPLLADTYLQIAGELASHAVSHAGELLRCPLASLASGPCLDDFVRTFGARMWRRPLTDGEAGKLVALFTTTAAQAGGAEAGFRNVVRGLFMSPSFLFRVELGSTQQAGAVTALTDYELASQLSYMLWDSAPDATLTDLAARGKLRDAATLAAQATRMLAVAAKAPRAMSSFLLQWLRIDDLAQRPKDATVFPLWSAQVAADLIDETRTLLGSVVFDAGGDRSLRTLLVGRDGYVNARTAPIYGVSKPAGTGLVKTALPAERRGLLTTAAFLAGHGNSAGTALVDRGKFLREQVLCSPLPPPIAANAKLAPAIANATNLTGRERFTMHSVDPACAVCHRLFDGLGFALESYDGIGKYRSTDKGKPIDASGTLPLPSGPELSFGTFVDLVDQLAGKPDAFACFASQYLGYASGRGADQIDDCERQQIADAFARSGYRLDALVQAVVASPGFTTRKN